MIDWLIAERDTIPPPGRILAPPEQDCYDRLRFAKRREDWLLGRWAAKRLLRRHIARRGLDLPPDAIMIMSDHDGAPRVVPWGMALVIPHIGAELGALQISISHTDGRALCAMLTRAQSSIYSLQPAIAVGADIEQVKPRGAAFAEAYDTDHELALLAAAPPDHYELLSTAIWSAKEATLKLTHHGLRVDTRAVTCLPAPPVAGQWASVVICTDLASTTLTGCWRELDGCVITIVYEYEEE
jgi:4'-phosphopantetheinyl transferase